jgi:hypothetical protein
MRRISTSIALVLSTVLLFVSASSAQQTATTTQQTATSTATPGNRTKLGGGPDTIVNCVGAQNGRISVFTAAAPPNITLCNSGIYEAAPYGTGAIGILNPNPIAALDVTGATNTSLYYEIGGATVLSVGGSPNNFNLFLGVGAGAQNAGHDNTFAGTYVPASTTPPATPTRSTAAGLAPRIPLARITPSPVITPAQPTPPEPSITSAAMLLVPETRPASITPSTVLTPAAATPKVAATPSPARRLASPTPSVAATPSPASSLALAAPVRATPFTATRLATTTL